MRLANNGRWKVTNNRRKITTKSRKNQRKTSTNGPENKKHITMHKASKRTLTDYIRQEKEEEVDPLAFKIKSMNRYDKKTP